MRRRTSTHFAELSSPDDVRRLGALLAASPTPARRVLLTTLVVVGFALQASLSHAQITLDGTIRPGAPRMSLTGPRVEVPSQAGAIVGNNLFHSFDRFNVQQNQTVTFTGPTSIANILSRVTGTERSFINGLIDSKTSMPTANFFLLNPNGVLFGAGATLNIGGAFYASTAGCVRAAGASCFGPDDGTRLKFFVDPSKTSVLAADAPAAFGFLGSNPVRIAVEGSTLRASTQQTLALIGGNAAFVGQTEQGLKITRATLAAQGGQVQLVSVASPGEVTFNPSLAVSAGTQLGRVNVSQGSLIDVGGAGAIGSGTVVIRGGALLVDASAILANTGNVDGARLGIDLRADDIRLTNGTSVATQTSLTGPATGRAGDISVTARTLTLSGGGGISSRSRNSGRGGDVTVTGTESVNVVGSSVIVSEATSFGQGGRVTIRTPSLSLSDRGTILSTSRLTGPGGAVDLEVGDLTITGGALIRSFGGTGGGRAGNITVRGANSVLLSGRGSGIFGTTAPGPLARGGDILLDNVGTVTLTDAARIQIGDLLAFGTPGSLTVKARDSVNISGGAGISSQANDKTAGPVTISTPAALTMDRGFINASTQGAGNAGDISLTAGTLALTRGAQVLSSSQNLFTNGQGGKVSITAGSISISGTSPTGVAVSPDTRDPRSGVFSTAEGRGPGGDIDIRSGSMRLTGDAIISAKSTGTRSALAGNVNIVVDDAFRMSNSTITTDAGVADGGNISLTGRHLVYVLESGITTSVRSGAGKGGNITIDPEFVVLDHSQVRADAFGGPGGKINIFSDFFLTNASVLSASSTLSTQGTITVQSRFTDVSSSVAPLPAGLAQAATLLRASCAARVAAGKASSLVIAGREGMPPEPGGYMPSPLTPLDLSDVRSSGGDVLNADTLPRLSLSVFAPACSR